MEEKMNNSYLDKLLEGVEVEWMALGEVCNIFTGGEPPLSPKPQNPKTPKPLNI